MPRLAQEFMEHETSSPILITIWTEFIFLSFFRSKERDYLRHLHIDSVNDKFLHTLAKYHIHHSKLRDGDHWIGGLKYDSIRLSTALTRIHYYSPKLTQFHNHYSHLIMGKFVFSRLFINYQKHLKSFKVTWVLIIIFNLGS